MSEQTKAWAADETDPFSPVKMREFVVVRVFEDGKEITRQMFGAEYGEPMPTPTKETP